MPEREKTEEELEAEVQALIETTRKKKKKHKKSKKSKKSPPSDSVGAKTDNGPYSYETLLKRAYMLLERDNPHLASTKTTTRLKLPPLNLCRYRTTRTNWSNFGPACRAMCRPPDHLLAFIENELAVNASVNGQGHLILPTRIETRGMTHILNRYVKTYVSCIRCQSCATTFRKDKLRRILYVACKTCKAESAAPPIRASGTSGHVALKKGDRYRARRGLTKK